MTTHKFTIKGEDIGEAAFETDDLPTFRDMASILINIYHGHEGEAEPIGEPIVQEPEKAAKKTAAPAPAAKPETKPEKAPAAKKPTAPPPLPVEEESKASPAELRSEAEKWLREMWAAGSKVVQADIKSLLATYRTEAGKPCVKLGEIRDADIIKVHRALDEMAERELVR